MTTETVVQVELDVFPARVRLTHGGTVEPVRALVADGDLVVWGNTELGPAVTHRMRTVSLEGSRSSGYSVLTDEGQVLITRARGCGCGSPLKRLDPFPGKRRMSVTRG